ncbi:thioredoxin-like protein [Cantharellus anzutake]|uniref:thioredoxin-like protein n=1 Tax=Cantharellus anzutake TaxID=1750568 RepID=UPI001902FD51|nr:thioredoxin-like protein [Cantharellus anzutake]KAF8329553.1 thioredoxin-like protein [Cantharellus anzutake]
MSFLAALRMTARSGSFRASTARPLQHTPRSFGAGIRWLTVEAREKIDGAIRGTPVVVFMKGTPDQPQCGFSRAVIQVLDVQGVPREKLATYNVLEDAELRSGIKEYSEWPTVPQVYINGDFIGGADILIGMHTSGELEELLEKARLLPELPSSSTMSSQT